MAWANGLQVTVVKSQPGRKLFTDGWKSILLSGFRSHCCPRGNVGGHDSEAVCQDFTRPPLALAAARFLLCSTCFPLSHHIAVPAIFPAVFPAFREAAEWPSVVSMLSAPLPRAAAAGEPLQDYLVPRPRGCSILSVAQRVCLSRTWTFVNMSFQWLITWSSQVDFCMYGKRYYNWRCYFSSCCQIAHLGLWFSKEKLENE